MEIGTPPLTPKEIADRAWSEYQERAAKRADERIERAFNAPEHDLSSPAVLAEVERGSLRARVRVFVLASVAVTCLVASFALGVDLFHGDVVRAAAGTIALFGTGWAISRRLR